MIPPTLSTNLFHDRARAQMGGLSAAADRLQVQIATGKQFAAPSDNSVAYARLQQLARDKADGDAYDANLDLAASLLQQAETTLGSMATAIDRASELVMKAGNGTLDATARTALGVELGAILDTLVQLANTNDTRGQPLFGGADGEPAVTRDGDVFTYSQGAPSSIPVGGGQLIQSGEPANRLFGLGSTDTLSVLQTLVARLSAGGTLDGDEASQAVDDLAAATDQLSTVRGTIGARATRVDILQSQAMALATDRETERSGLEDTDVTAAVVELQKTMTTLQATQASFAKLSALSLFDYLR